MESKDESELQRAMCLQHNHVFPIIYGFLSIRVLDTLPVLSRWHTAHFKSTDASSVTKQMFRVLFGRWHDLSPQFPSEWKRAASRGALVKLMKKLIGINVNMLQEYFPYHFRCRSGFVARSDIHRPTYLANQASKFFVLLDSPAMIELFIRHTQCMWLRPNANSGAKRWVVRTMRHILETAPEPKRLVWIKWLMSFVLRSYRSEPLS